jgi:uncharacterized protein YlxW (UPF0749 family)
MLGDEPMNPNVSPGVERYQSQSLTGIAPSSNVASGPTANAARRRTFGNNWIYSLTGICFLCGALIAMQVRTIKRVSESRADNLQAQALVQKQANRNRIEALKAKQQTAAAQRRLDALRVQLASTGNISRKQLQALNTQIKQLQLAAGLTVVSGPGIRIVMTDNPSAAGAGGNSPFLPGVVHDFDLLQVVNELRAAGAEAISINGARITAYTPIRCVGPTIRINWEAAAPPFVIEAIGDPSTLSSAVNMPGGILQNLKNPEMGPALGIKTTSESRLKLSAAEGGAPRFKAATVGN